jgi:hypothetical protein
MFESTKPTKRGTKQKLRNCNTRNWRYGRKGAIRNCWTEMLARSLGRIIILVHFRSKRKYNFIQHCFCDLGSHFEALESVLPIFFLGFASKKYDQTDSRAPKCLPRVTKTVMYIVNTTTFFEPDFSNNFERFRFFFEKDNV